MKLGNLLLLAGAALAANEFLKTSKGKQFKRTAADKANQWKDKLTDMMQKQDGQFGHTGSEPTDNAFNSGGKPM